MSFLPIVARELRLRSRGRGLYFLRSAAAGLAMLIASGMMLAQLAASGSGVMLGAPLFNVLAFLAFVFCLFEGVRNTADGLSEEKREGTLGLLFLTDLRGLDVVLGKFAAASVPSFWVLVAVWPILGLPLLMGGVTAAQYWGVVLVLSNTLFFSLASGMAVSAVSRQQQRAWAAALSLVSVMALLPLLLQGLTSLLGAMAGLSGPGSPTLAQAAGLSHHPSFLTATQWLARLSPTTALLSALGATGRSTGELWPSLGAVHLLGWLLLGGAAYWLPRSWQDTPGRRNQGYGELSATAQAGRVAFRQELGDVNPVVWAALRDRPSSTFAWVLALLAVLVTVAAVWVVPEMAFAERSLIGPLQVVLEIWVALRASRFFAEARACGALELLAVTPLTSKDLIAGQFLALRRQFLGPVATLLAGQLVLTGVNLYHAQSSPGVMMLLWNLYKQATFITGLAALAYFGMWMGMRARKPTRAGGLTILFVMVLPSFVVCVPNLVTDLVFFFVAKRGLGTDFRWHLWRNRWRSAQ